MTESSPSKRIPLSTMLLYSTASLGMGFFFAFNNFSLPLYLKAYTSNDALIGILANTRSFEGSIIQPIVGAWSDRTWTRLGRRKPFFAFVMPLVAVLILYCSLHPPFPLLIAADLVFTLLFNLGADPYTALQSDIAAPEQLGTLNSLASLLSASGQLVFALVSGLILWAINPAFSFYLVAGGLLLTFAVTSLGIREQRSSMVARQRLHLKEHFTTLPRYREALKFYLVQFLLWFGINAATPFLTLFASREIAGVSGSTAQILAALLLAVTAVFCLPVGLLADRISRKALLAAGLGLFGVCSLAAALFAHTLPQLVVLIVLLGIANTGHTVLSYPLLTELVPSERIGEFWGVNTFFASAGALFSAALAGWLADAFGTYRAVFALTGICMLAALIVLQLVRPEKARAQLELGQELA